jgi:hypothetical protein
MPEEPQIFDYPKGPAQGGLRFPMSQETFTSLTPQARMLAMRAMSKQNLSFSDYVLPSDYEVSFSKAPKKEVYLPSGSATMIAPETGDQYSMTGHGMDQLVAQRKSRGLPDLITLPEFQERRAEAIEERAKAAAAQFDAVADESADNRKAGIDPLTGEPIGEEDAVSERYTQNKEYIPQTEAEIKAEAGAQATQATRDKQAADEVAAAAEQQAQELEIGEEDPAMAEAADIAAMTDEEDFDPVGEEDPAIAEAVDEAAKASRPTKPIAAATETQRAAVDQMVEDRDIAQRAAPAADVPTEGAATKAYAALGDDVDYGLVDTIPDASPAAEPPSPEEMEQTAKTVFGLLTGGPPINGVNNEDMASLIARLSDPDLIGMSPEDIVAALQAEGYVTGLGEGF